MEHTDDINGYIGRVQKKAIGVGALGAALTLGVLALRPDIFSQAYLFAYIFWIGIALGSLALLMVHHMVGGGWGFMIQRILEAASRTLPLMAILFVPILLCMRQLYPWANPEEVAASHIIGNKALYLNVPFFIGRQIGYFALWMGLATLLSRWSKQLDETGDVANIIKYRKLSPAGVILYVLSITFAATDWAMSLEPEWFSTMYGPIFFVSQGLSTLAFSIICLSILYRFKPLSDAFRIDFYHHLGNLMLAFTVLWAYTSFSQFLIIWSGNLPEETTWYLHRSGGLVNGLIILLIVFHFAVPLLVLLQRQVKLTIGPLRIVAGGILVMRLIDLSWIIKPAFYPNFQGFGIFNLGADVVVFVGLGGIWLAMFLRELKSRPLLVKNDPRLIDALAKLHPEEEEVGEHA